MANHMKVVTPYLQHKITKSALVILLIVYSTITTIYALRMKAPVLIAIEAGKARLVTETNVELQEKERLALVKEFVKYFTEYDSESFETRVGQAFDMVSDDVWKVYKDQFRQKLTELKGKDFSQQSRITKIELIDQRTYQVGVEVTQLDRALRQKKFGSIKIIIDERTRTEANPAGHTISQVEETWTNQ